tara:strand:+ start:1070 stop:1891 length:822 start_codon:yes stop_codon:yes gene_type:complete
MKKYKYLVTGHEGFIGSRLYSSLPNSKIGFDLKSGEDILDCLPSDIQVDTVFHLAALPRVEYSVENPSYTLKHNVLATSVLLDWCRTHGVKRFIFSSSAAAHGDGSGPNSPYGLHKLISEKECKLYSELYDLDTVCLRYFNVYSENQPYGGPYSTVISAWMEMLHQDKPLPINGDGEQTRDYIHVDDIVSVNLFCESYKERFNGETFEVGTGIETSIKEIKKIISTKGNIQWNSTPARHGDIKFSVANTEKLNRIGWSSSIDILSGLKKCFKL